MKKLIFCASMALFGNGFCHTLSDFNAIKSAAIKGNTIHMAVDFLACDGPSQPLLDPVLIGVITPDLLAITQDKIATSTNHFTLNDPSFSGKPVYEFVRYTFTSDNNLEIWMQVLDAKSFSKLSDKYTYQCKNGQGVKVYASK